ncbi:hypothetical protein NX059_003973 [Plenodomus lindquistii]|nr:hypothetical protein NX059_003973 [Plenodomus lindquistii]
MLKDESGRRWTGGFDYTTEHHKSIASLQRSTEANCAICVGLSRTLGDSVGAQKQLSQPIRAVLRKSDPEYHGIPGVAFLLDFDLGGNRERAFVLYEGKLLFQYELQLLTSKDKSQIIKAPRAVPNDPLLTARNWMSRCTCADFWKRPGKKWYPRRLLDLRDLRTRNNNNNNNQQGRVFLVESSEVAGLGEVRCERKASHQPSNDRYVTLSHCWGVPKAGKQILRLTFDTERDFKRDGILLRDLPKTFREAAVFASQLDNVGYIWIDSLCIRQSRTDTGLDDTREKRDWLEQGRLMDKVYRKAYLNISATASPDTNGGLFLEQRLKTPRDDIVNVRYPESRLGMKPKAITRCKVVDVSAWDDIVEHAPVNRRAWVLQERFMAPRVLHFSHNQMAWECTEFQDAEGLSESHLTTRVVRSDIVQDGLFKDLTAHAGRRFRETRLRGVPDPDERMPDLYIFELWKHVVELYSQTQLTHDSDKLMALAGISRHFREKLFSANNKSQFVAGLWSQNLESQLLWQANEVYVDGRYDNPAKRNDAGLPSFSWASINSPRGITYGDVTNYAITDASDTSLADHASELLFRILDHEIVLVDPLNPFGMIVSGRLLLKARYLQRIELQRLPKNSTCWRLKDATERSQEFTNMYLDTPDHAIELFRKNSELYCMPAAYGERTVLKRDRDLYCLLLKYEGSVLFRREGTSKGRSYQGFTRIGIAKMSSTFGHRGQEILCKKEVDEVLCLC